MSKMGLDLIYEDIVKESKENCCDSENKLNEFLKSLSYNDKKKLREKLFEETEDIEENVSSETLETEDMEESEV